MITYFSKKNGFCNFNQNLSMRIHAQLITLFLLPGTLSYGQSRRMDSIIQISMQESHTAGLAACLIENGKVQQEGYYGYQNIDKKKLVGPQTIFMLASVSKTVTAAALMKLYESNKFTLDDDINIYLPFKVRNPNFPDLPITFRQLLRHRSSINDDDKYLQQFWKVNNGDPSLPLNLFLSDYLSPDGKHYNRQTNFLPEKPGTKFSYSNVGYALIGYLIEMISGMPFDRYCEETIFKPLSMDNTSWYLKGLDTNKIAIPYTYSDALKKHIPYRFGGYPDYPAGQLRTTLSDLSHFLIAWSQKGRWNNQQVFDSTAIQELTPDDYSLGWHTWFMYALDTEHLLYSHAGGDNGVSNYIVYDRKKGVIILTNGENNDYFRWRKLIDVLYHNGQ
jgi:CubicO group peptidase (beta-lactamase class C family)